MMLYSTKTFLVVLTCFFFHAGSDSLKCEPENEPDSEEAQVELQYGKSGSPEERLRVVPEMARIRQAPGLNSIALGLAPGGLLVQPLEKNGDWYRVSLPDRQGVEGWIRADLLEPLLKLEGEADAIAARVAPSPAPTVAEVAVAEPSGKTKSLQPYRPEELSIERGAVGSDPSYLLSLFLTWTLFVSFSALGLAVFLPRD